MWVVHLALGLTALYAAIITAMYFAQTWLLFPTALARAAAARPPTSTKYLEVKTHDGESLAGMRIRSVGAKAEGSPTLVGFGGNLWSAWTMALTSHALFPDRDVVTFHYRGYAPSSGRPSATAVLSDSLVIFDHLRQVQADEPILAIGFSIGSAVAAYVARHRPVAGLILVTPFGLARDLGPRSLLVGSCRPASPPSYAHDRVRSRLARARGLIIAQRDRIVPARRSAPLRLAIGNLVFERTIDAGHNDIFDRPAFAKAMRDALARIEACNRPG